MEAELDTWIGQAEASWLDALYNHARSLFRNSSLPSHDHTHHLRVWNLCKTLLREIATFNSLLDQKLVEGLLIAAFFHDLGMADSTREDHGKQGRELCLSWFRESGNLVPANLDEILRAIEFHDRKEMQIYPSFDAENPPEILGILSTADDLDALGTIGIFRYAEIYLRRGIPLEELGGRILENAKSRFSKLRRTCRLCSGLIETYQHQYDELRHFYEHYRLQLKETSQAEMVTSGQLGVINYIRIRGLNFTFLDSSQTEVVDYFRKLSYELEQARL